MKIYLFGPPRLERDGQPVQIKRRKGLAMLSYLAVTAKSHSRDALAALFWAEFDRSKARSNLRRELAALNKTLGKEQLSVDREQIGLNSVANLWLDVEQFQTQLAQCDMHGHPTTDICSECIPPLRHAVNVYSQDFLAGFSLADSPEFDEWQFFQSENLRQQLAGALEKLTQALCAQEGFSAAIPYARRWAQLDPLHEPAQHQLMLVYAQDGQRTAAWRHYEIYASLLKIELDVAPGEEISALYQYARRELRGNRPSSTSQTSILSPTMRIHSLPSHNLPPQSTPFIGREQELAEVQQLVQYDDSCRLLTLIGAGGIGKTRLALQAATNMSDGFADGVCFIPLAPVSDASYLLSAITDGLNLAFAGGADPKTQLLRYLQEKHLLLVLDNFEHLSNSSDPETIKKIALLSDLVQSSARLKLLVTSRERLNLPDAWSFEVEGLPFPMAVSSADSRDIEEYSAVNLFVQQARRTQATFKLARDADPHVIRICRLVGGMPLGLELAAAWVHMMSCQEIADEIERNYDFLVTTKQHVAMRHQSLQAVFAYSWNLLSKPEQTILSRLAVFRGGFLREAAEQIMNASLHNLSSLMDKSLLRRNHSGRYEIHELLRQFAAEKLSTHPRQLEDVEDRHSHFYLDYLYQLEAGLKSSRQNEALKAIGADIDNIRVAWRRAVERQFAEKIWFATTSLWLYHEVRSNFREAESLLQLAVDGLRETSQATFWEKVAYVQVAADHGWFVTRLGQLPQAKHDFEEAQSIINQLLTQNSLDELQKNIVQQSLARTLCYLGNHGILQAIYSEGGKAIEEGYEIWKQLGDPWWCALHLVVRGIQAEYAGDFMLADQLNQESLRYLDGIGEIGYVKTNGLTSLGRTARYKGAYEESERMLQQSLQLCQRIDIGSGVTFAFSALGDLAEAREEYEQAKIYQQKCLHLAEETGRSYMIAYTQAALGRLARFEGDATAAITLSNKCATLAQTIDDKIAMALSRNNLGYVALMNESYQDAHAHFQSALEISRRVETDFMVADALMGLATLARIEGRTEQAITLLSFTVHCESFYFQDRIKARKQLSALAAQGSAEVVASTQERTMSQTVESMVAAVLDTV